MAVSERCCDLKTVRIVSCWEIVSDGEWGKGWLVRCRIRKTIVLVIYCCAALSSVVFSAIVRFLCLRVSKSVFKFIWCLRVIAKVVAVSACLAIM
jgi:hypothetical protein